MNYWIVPSKIAVATLMIAGLALEGPAAAIPTNEPGIAVTGESFTYLDKRTAKHALEGDDSSFRFVYRTNDPSDHLRYVRNSPVFKFSYSMEIHNHRSDPVRVRSVSFDILDEEERVIRSDSSKITLGRYIPPNSTISESFYHSDEALIVADGTPLMIRITGVEIDPPLDYVKLGKACLFLSELTNERLAANADLEADYAAFEGLPGMPRLEEFQRMSSSQRLDVFEELLNLIPNSFSGADQDLKRAMDNYYSQKYLITYHDFWKTDISAKSAANRFITLRKAQEHERRKLEEADSDIELQKKDIGYVSIYQGEVAFLNTVKSALNRALKTYSSVSKDSPNYNSKRIAELQKEIAQLSQKITQVAAKEKREASAIRAQNAKREREFRRQCSRDQLRILDKLGRPSDITTSISALGRITSWWYGTSVMYQFANGKLVHVLRSGN